MHAVQYERTYTFKAFVRGQISFECYPMISGVTRFSFRRTSNAFQWIHKHKCLEHFIPINFYFRPLILKERDAFKTFIKLFTRKHVHEMYNQVKDKKKNNNNKANAYSQKVR